MDKEQWAEAIGRYEIALGKNKEMKTLVWYHDWHMCYYCGGKKNKLEDLRPLQVKCLVTGKSFPYLFRAVYAARLHIK